MAEEHRAPLQLCVGRREVHAVLVDELAAANGHAAAAVQAGQRRVVCAHSAENIGVKTQSKLGV